MSESEPKIIRKEMAGEPEYLNCPKCGSDKIIHDGGALDHGYIKCLNCSFSIPGGEPYELVKEWNELPRKK